MSTRSHHIRQSLLIGIAVIPITMAMSYVLTVVFDRREPANGSANRHGLGGLSVLAPIPYMLIADLVRRRPRSP